MAENQTCISELTEHQELMIQNISWIFECVFTLLLAPFGILFNALAIYLLSTTKLFESFFNRLLSFMATFDMLYLIVSVSEAIRQYLIKSCSHDYIFVIMVYPLRSILMCCSTYTTLALALERFVNVCKPLSRFSQRGGKPGKHWIRVVKYILPIVIFSTVLYAPKFFELQTVDCKEQCYVVQSDNNTNCTNQRISVTQLRRNESYVLWYVTVCKSLFDWALPFVILAYLNIRIYLQLKQYLYRKHYRHKHQDEKQPSDIHQAIILFSIVILFFICHLPRVTLNVQEFVRLIEVKYALNTSCNWIKTGSKYWIKIMLSFSHFLLKFNASVNFFIYVAFDQNFRNLLRSNIPANLRLNNINSHKTEEIELKKPEHQ